MNRTIHERVAELSATLKPIEELLHNVPVNLEYLYEQAEDSISYNQSYYCYGQKILCDYDSECKCCILESVGDFQVLRFYDMGVHMDAFDFSDVEDDDDFDMPELETTGYTEYQQIWISQTLETYTLDIAEDNTWYDKSIVVVCKGLQPWSFEPRCKKLIESIVNEEPYFGRELKYHLSMVNEYLTKNEPLFASCIVSTNNTHFATEYYKTFRIAHRHHWKFPNSEYLTKLYVDYLKMLKSEGRDLLNPKFICPENIEQAHNILFEHKNKKDFERQLTTARLYQDKFDELHGYLTGIEFDTDKFHFESLDSPEDYIWEGKIMHHCVGRMKFYQRHELLTMHISDHEGNRVATTSVDVKNRSIDELQTICNESTWREGSEYNEIWNILMAMMHTFPQYRPINNIKSNVA